VLLNAYKQSPIIPVRFQMDNTACHLLETMALQGQQDPLLTMWVTQLRKDF
jgi:hypothetical protein